MAYMDPCDQTVGDFLDGVVARPTLDWEADGHGGAVCRRQCVVLIVRRVGNGFRPSVSGAWAGVGTGLQPTLDEAKAEAICLAREMLSADQAALGGERA